MALLDSLGHSGQPGRVGPYRLLSGQQPDILYLVVTDENGEAVAHSDPEQISEKHQSETAVSSLVGSDKVQWHQVQMQGGSFAFEVYKRFKPIRGKGGRGHMHHHGMMRGSGFPRDWAERSFESEGGENGGALYIFVGLDMSAMESARAEARRHTVAMSIGVLLIGLEMCVNL